MCPNFASKTSLMIIANPIYDAVFKRMMEDSRSARFFIGTLLNETVTDVIVAPQEFSLQIENKEKEKAATLALLRMDFVATIKTAGGTYKRVLIEIQKSRRFIDIARFRTYLGSQYQKKDDLVTENGLKVTLPIVTIYVLGFNLPEIASPAIKVARQYTDLISNTVIEKKSEFIEQLTHDCFVVQITRIDGKVQSRLERLLSVFEQKYFITESDLGIKDYNYEVTDEELDNLLRVLGYVVADEGTRKQIAAEQEALRVMDVATEQVNAKLEVANKKLAEQKTALGLKDRVIMAKDIELEEKDRALEEKGKAMEENDRELEEKDLALKKAMEELEKLRGNTNS